MKKIFTTLLAGLLVLGFAAAAPAQETAEGQFPKVEKQVKLQERVERKEAKLEALKAIQDEIHRINALRMEKNNLQNEVIAKKDTILDLQIKAREEGNWEGLKEAKEYRKQVGTVNQEIKELTAKVAENRKAAREALKNGNGELAEQHLNNIIGLKTEINEKIEAKVDLLDKIIAVLS